MASRGAVRPAFALLPIGFGPAVALSLIDATQSYLRAKRSGGNAGSSQPARLARRERLSDVTDLDGLKIPAATRPAAEAIIALSDEACAELLDDEYADLARHVVAKLARKRPSPILSGRPSTWAGAVVYALGQVNFLFDPSTKPYATPDDLSTAFGCAKTTLGTKAKQVRDLLKMDYGSIDFLRNDVADSNPMAWFVEVDGLIMDARSLPVELQAQAFARGLIPYIPALGRDGTAQALAEASTLNAQG
jgi:hypothetical protein